MTYKAHVKNGIVVLDDNVKLPEGSSLLVQYADSSTTLGELMRDVAGRGIGLPNDGSIQHDHYISGIPKQ